MQEHQKDIEKLILATLVYYNLFDFPLTHGEIEKYLLKAGGDFAGTYIEMALSELVESAKIISDRGFFALPKREQIIPTRIRKTRVAVNKMRIARRAVRWMSIVPYVRGVFASGSLALENTSEESDLDFFVITKAGRIWTARFLVTILLSLLRIRRKASDRIAPDKVCLNHYISDDALAITNQNIFTARIYAHLVPLYLNKPHLMDEFKKQNQWVLSYVQSWPTNNQCLLENNGLLKSIKFIKEIVLNSPIGTWFEKWTRNYQKFRIERNPKTHDPHGRIEYNDHVLQFHPDSIENSILKKYEHRITHL